MNDATLLDLFREEVRGNVQVLNDGLVDLERRPDHLGAIEPMMRAAHSIKGAARVIGIDPVVRLAHVLEDCFVHVQGGKLRLGARDVDLLLAAVDLLGRAGDAAGPDFEPRFATDLASLNQLVTQIGSLVAGQTLPEERVAVSTPMPEESSSFAEAEAVIPEPFPAPQSAVALDWPTHPPEALPEPVMLLYASETRSQSGMISTLISFTTDATAKPEQLEPLTVAARSMKSAAALIRLKPATDIARALEAILFSRQNSAAPLTPHDAILIESGVAAAIRWCDAAVSRPPEWYTTAVEQTSNTAVMLMERAGLGAANSPAVPDRPPDKTSVVGTPKTPQLPVAVPTPAAVPPTGTSPAETGPVAEPKSARNDAGDGKERVVRVSAQSLTRLTSLAGESLVLARWLQPFSKALLDLKRRHSRLADGLESLAQRLNARHTHELLPPVLDEVVANLNSCQELLAQRMTEFEDHARQSDDLNSRLYREVLTSRMRPFQDGVQGFPRMIRDVARQLEKQVTFEVRGQMTDVDRDILEKLEAPLNHILRNALDHGMETPEERVAAGKPPIGTLILDARHSSGMLSIKVIDDGRGIDTERVRRKIVERKLTTADMASRMDQAELLEFLFLPGFSTAERVTDISGRGVGLDVVHTMVNAVGGSVTVTTAIRQGTTFHLKLPITLSVLRAVLVRIGGEPYAFPHMRVDQLVRAPRETLRAIENRQYVEIDGVNTGLVLADQLLELNRRSLPEGDLNIVLFSHGRDRYGLVIDEVLGEQDLVVRPLDHRLGKTPDIGAASILDDGSPVLILDVDDLRRNIERLLESTRLQMIAQQTGKSVARQRILVVDDSITVREVERQLLKNRGYDVDTAVDGVDGWNMVRRNKYDMVVSDVDMPRMNGFEFVRKIKDDESLRGMPVVIVSYKDRPEDRMRGLEVGANYYLTKSSFHDEKLLDVVRELIGEAT